MIRSGTISGLTVLFLSVTGGAAAQEDWSVAERPDLVIGTAEGPQATMFHDIRGAIVASDGSIVVANGLGQLRVFSRSGGFVREFGGVGDGPEEFRFVRWIDACGEDGVVAYDQLRRRITKWDLEGRLLDAFPTEGTSPERPPYRVSCGPDGGFAVVGWPEVRLYTGEPGPYRLDVDVGVLDSRGRLIRRVGTFPGPERYRYAANDGPRPLGKNTIVRSGPDGIYVGTADSYEILLIGPDGTRRTIGRDVPPTPMTRELVRIWHDSVVARMPANRRANARRGLQGHQHPEVLPAYSDLMVDGRGLLWVRRYGVPGGEVAEWDVFESGGAHVARVRFPRSFRITQVGDAFLLGVHTDDMGIQRVHRYGLTRG